MIEKLWAFARRIDELKSKAVVVLTSVVTVLAVIASVLQVVIVDLSASWPTGAGWAAQVLAGLLVVITLIRRVAPVAKDERGLT